MKTLIYSALLGLGILFATGCEKETPWTEESESFPWIDDARMGRPENPCFPDGKPGAKILIEDNCHTTPDDELSPSQGRDHSEVYPWIDQP